MREAKKEENKSFYLTYCNFNIGGLFTSGSARLGKLGGGGGGRVILQNSEDYETSYKIHKRQHILGF